MALNTIIQQCIIIICLQVNSYQATIVTDVLRTYTIFSYMCGDVQWSSLGRNRAAVVGFNSEGYFFENHPLSGFSGVGDAVSCTFSIGKRRKRQNGDMPNNLPMILPAEDEVMAAVEECLAAEARDEFALFGFAGTPQTLADMLDPCPCSVQQAIADHARFRQLDDPSNCYVSSTPVNVMLLVLGQITLTQMCCYVNG